MKYITNRFSLQARTGFPWDSYVNDSLLAVAGVALITSVIAGTHLYATLPAIAFLYLPLISILASTRGLYAALLASLLAVLSFDFFIFPPSFTFILLNATDALTLGIFLAAAILTGQLPSILQRRVVQAKRREKELRLFYAQAQEIALLQERQYLARELHDSLAQTLYGIGLEVETAQKPSPRTHNKRRTRSILSAPLLRQDWPRYAPCSLNSAQNPWSKRGWSQH